MRFHLHNLREMLLASVSLLTLGACANQTSSAGISSRAQAPSKPLFCSEAPGPILFDRLKDTEQTIAQIRVYNAIGVKLCGWTGAKASTK